MEEDVYASIGSYNDSSGGDGSWASSEQLLLWDADTEDERSIGNSSHQHNQLFPKGGLVGGVGGGVTGVGWNVSNATGSWPTDDPFEANNYWALLALVLVLGTAAGNILVCLAIAWERRLQNVTNYFLMSLAITDLMVAVLVMPLGILTLVKGESIHCTLSAPF